MALLRLVPLTVVAVVALGSPATRADTKKLCELAEKTALKKALKAVGGSIAEDIGGEAAKATGRAVAGATIVGLDAILEYFTHPDDTRLDAAMHKLLEGGTKIIFPAYGIAAASGRFLLGSTDTLGFAATTVEHVIDAAKAGQLDAFICGDRSYDNLFTQTNFFDINAVSQRGITCNNFTEKITTQKELDQMNSLWFGYYKRHLIEMNPGPQNQKTAERLLAEGWNKLEHAWKVVWAEKIYGALRDALKHEAAQFPETKSKCAAEPNAPNQLVLAGREFEVFDDSTKDFKPGRKGFSPTSSWETSDTAFHFESRKDGFKLTISWDDLPATLVALVPVITNIKVDLDGPRKAQVVLGAAMNITGWRLRPTTGTGKRVGPNAFKLEVAGSTEPGRPTHASATMPIEIIPVGIGASLKQGVVEGGTGKLYRGDKPDAYDSYILELELNGMAKLRWTYAPEGSPLLKK